MLLLPTKFDECLSIYMLDLLSLAEFDDSTVDYGLKRYLFDAVSSSVACLLFGGSQYELSRVLYIILQTYKISVAGHVSIANRYSLLSLDANISRNLTKLSDPTTLLKLSSIPLFPTKRYSSRHCPVLTPPSDLSY